MSYLATLLNKKHFFFFALVLFMVPNMAAANVIEATLWKLVIAVFGSFAGLGGLLLNSAIEFFVVKGYDQSLVSTINDLWGMTRDLFNLTFIFGLLYIGFKMILDSENSNTRRWLVSLILAALLINFSLYITKVVIDVSNIIATQIVTGPAFPLNNAGKIDISGAFMNSLGIQSLFKSPPPKGDGAYGTIFGTAILFIVMGFVFAAGGVLLIIRYAVLAMYMILSPLMFLGWVFPQMQDVTNKYWKGFLGRAFFAPIYLLLIYFSYTIVNNFFANKFATADYTKVLGKGGKEVLENYESSLPPFILACIFLIASLVIAQKLGADGASTAVSMGKNLSNRARRVVTVGAGAATAGLAARGLRNTVGRGADALTRSEGMKKWAAKSKIGKQVFQTTQKTATRSFDARQVAGVGAALGVGTGAVGGYKKSVEDRKKSDAQFMKDIHIDLDMNDPETRDKVRKREAEIKQAAANELDEYKKLEKSVVDESEKKKEHIQNNTKLSDDERKRKLQQLDDETYKSLDAIQEKTDALTKIISDKGMARNQAMAETEYANELAYIKTLESSQQFWSGRSAKFGSGAAGVGAGSTAVSLAGLGVVAGGATLGVGALAGMTAAGARADRLQQSIDDLRRQYGVDGTKMASTKRRQKDFEDFAAAQRKFDAQNPPSPQPQANPPTPETTS